MADARGLHDGRHAVEQRLEARPLLFPCPPHISHRDLGRAGDAGIGDGQRKRSADVKCLRRLPSHEIDRLAVDDDGVVDAARRAVVEALHLVDQRGDVSRLETGNSKLEAGSRKLAVDVRRLIPDP